MYSRILAAKEKMTDAESEVQEKSRGSKRKEESKTHENEEGLLGGRGI